MKFGSFCLIMLPMFTEVLGGIVEVDQSKPILIVDPAKNDKSAISADSSQSYKPPSDSQNSFEQDFNIKPSPKNQDVKNSDSQPLVISQNPEFDSLLISQHLEQNKNKKPQSSGSQPYVAPPYYQPAVYKSNPYEDSQPYEQSSSIPQNYQIKITLPQVKYQDNHESHQNSDWQSDGQWQKISGPFDINYQPTKKDSDVPVRPYLRKQPLTSKGTFSWSYSPASAPLPAYTPPEPSSYVPPHITLYKNDRVYNRTLNAGKH